jgi:hypothetical protein
MLYYKTRVKNFSSLSNFWMIMNGLTDESTVFAEAA